MAKPKIIVDNQKSGSVEVCCDGNCVELEVKGTNGSTTTSTGSTPVGTIAAPTGPTSTGTGGGQSGTTVAPAGGRYIPPNFTPDPLGIGATQFAARYGIEGFEHLLKTCSQIHHAWSSQKWRLDNGAFIFEIRNISRIDLSKIGAVTQLSADTGWVVYLRLFD